MKTLNKFRSCLAVLAGIAVACSAHAVLIVTPGDAVASGNETSQSEIDAIIGPIIAPSTEVYKADFGGPESGSLAGSYNTTFTPPIDPTNALIEWVDGTPTVQDRKWALVKDGAQIPAWYLFDLTGLGWDGMEDLLFQGFWEGTQGSISHVALYGGDGPNGGPGVPDGGTTMTLLGAGILALEGLRRRLKVA